MIFKKRAPVKEAVIVEETKYKDFKKGSMEVTRRILPSGKTMFTLTSRADNAFGSLHNLQKEDVLILLELLAAATAPEQE